MQLFAAKHGKPNFLASSLLCWFLQNKFHKLAQNPREIFVIWIFSFLLLQMFLTEKDKVVVVTRIVYFSEQAFVLGFLGPQRALK